MKKHLLATTALAAATGLVAFSGSADAAEKLKLGIGGYFQAYVGYFDADDNDTRNATGINGTGDYRSFDFFREAEIHFNGEVALDNGMKVGIDVQLEAETCGDQIDESYLYFQGDFGKVILGSENSAAYLMSYGAPAADANFDGADPNYAFNPLADAFGSQYSTLAYAPNMTSDSEKITYMSPRFAGFAAGVSWTPDNTEDGDGSSIPARRNDGNGIGRSQGTAQRDIWELAVNYENKFGDFGILAGVTYGFASDLERRAPDGADEQEEFSAGLNVTYGAFTVGGGYWWTNSGIRNNGDTSAWALGAAWANGPLRVGVSFMDYEIEANAIPGNGVIGGTPATYALTNPDEDANIQRYGIGASYVYAPGMQLRGSAYYYDWDGPDDDMIAVLLGTVITF